MEAAIDAVTFLKSTTWPGLEVERQQEGQQVMFRVFVAKEGKYAFVGSPPAGH
jgi:hypothetical protein